MNIHLSWQVEKYISMIFVQRIIPKSTVIRRENVPKEM